MKLLFQILYFLFFWFYQPANATPVFTKVALPSYELTFSKTDNVNNVKEESLVKISLENFARSNIEENEAPQTASIFIASPFTGGATLALSIATATTGAFDLCYIDILQNQYLHEYQNDATFRNAWNAMYTTIQIVDGIVAASAVITSLPQFYKLSKVNILDNFNRAYTKLEAKPNLIKRLKERWASKGNLVNGAGRFIANSGTELRTHLNVIVNKPLGKSYNGKMFRYIPEQYPDAKLIVQTSTSEVTNRFKSGLYLSETKAGNVIEVSSYGGTSGKQLYEFTYMQVNNLLDLTDANTIEILGTTFEQMKLTGMVTPYEFTQEVAIWAKNNGYSGIKFYGSQGGNTDYTNFVIFEQPIVNSAIKGLINPISW